MVLYLLFIYFYNSSISVSSDGVCLFLLYNNRKCGVLTLLIALSGRLSTAKNIWFQMVVLHIFKTLSISSYFNSTRTFSVLIDHYSFLYGFVLNSFCIFWHFFPEIFVSSKINTFLQIQKCLYFLIVKYKLWLREGMNLDLNSIGNFLVNELFVEKWGLLTHALKHACIHAHTHTHLALPSKGTHCFSLFIFLGTLFWTAFWYFTLMFKAVDLFKLIILAQGRRFMCFSVLSTFLLYFRIYHIVLFVSLMYDFVRESLAWSSSFPNYFPNFIMIFQKFVLLCRSYVLV